MTISREKRDRLVVELIRQAEELEWALRLANGWAPTPSLPEVPQFAHYLLEIPPMLADESSRDVLVRFAILYKEELTIVRAARNRVAHALELDDDTLATAVQVARTLVELLRKLVGAAEASAPATITVAERAALERAARANGWSSNEMAELVSIVTAIRSSTHAWTNLDKEAGWEKIASVTTDVRATA